MQTQEIHVVEGRVAIVQVRRQLLAFPEVLDVLAVSRPHSLIVVFCGRPRPAEWGRHLRAAGYELFVAPTRRSQPTSEEATGSPSIPLRS